MRRSISQLLAAALLGFATPAFAADSDAQDMWKVPTVHAHCVLRNKQDFLDRPGAIVLIVLEECVAADPLASALSELKPQSGFMADVKTGSSEEQTTKLISYPRSELECLNESHLVIEGDVALLPKTVNCE